MKQLGGKAYKFSSPNNRAVPDRICLFPRGIIALVELKAPGKKPTPLQTQVFKSMAKNGHLVLVIDKFETVDAWCNQIASLLNPEMEVTNDDK